MTKACFIRIRGVVQGVGFRPFVYRLAGEHSLLGWVRNGSEGVEIHVEGGDVELLAFLRELKTKRPPAAIIAAFEVTAVELSGFKEFTIRESVSREQPTVRVSPDLPVCKDCLRELFDPNDRRYHYPYINCTNCGPRYSVIYALPYDRANTTMKRWLLDDFCEKEYRNPANRRFHAQPVACHQCGPTYRLHPESKDTRGQNGIVGAAAMLRSGNILAVKGLGGYHLACDARNAATVATLRDRKYRKEKPFALMVKDLATARTVVELSADGEALLASAARPIVLAPAKIELSNVSPDNTELGIMLPYTPLHFLLFSAGAPDVLVMTSANRSSEPIAYEDEDALQRLDGVADAFLIGERPIARRIDDSVARAGVFGPTVLRRARGYSPDSIAKLPAGRPILALGADLKNSVTLVVNGQAFVSQHIGDLDHYQSLRSFREAIDDLTSMYGVRWQDLILVHDLHPEYYSTAHAIALNVAETHAVQHHRAHVASVLAEREAWTKQVIGVSFDGTGYGDDGSIWGGELFIGSVSEGFSRVAHLRPATLAGGDAAARSPVQAAAGFLAQVEGLPDMLRQPFAFPQRYRNAMGLVRNHVRSFLTTSMGRLFDAAAAMLGFTREVTFEGQAAMWLEQIARSAANGEAYPLPFDGAQLDFRPLLQAVAIDRARGQEIKNIARSFQRGVAVGLANALLEISRIRGIDTIVLSGGVFQNELLLEDLKSLLTEKHLDIWTNHVVPANDGGISLGQAALAAFGQFDRPQHSGECASELSHA